MIIIYGIRPFLKGVVHAMLYEEWELQIWFLVGIEAFIVGIIIVFEILFKSHRSKLILGMQIFYSGCLIGLNVILLFRHKYLG